MFCRKCGSPIPDDSLFCPKCGTRVDVPSGGPSGFRYAWPPDPAVRQYGLFEFAGWFAVKGRMARKEYWQRELTMFAATIVIGLAWGFAGWNVAALYLTLIPAYISNICIHVRRLHDLGVSGWWFLLVMLAGGFTAGLFGSDAAVWLYNIGMLAVFGSVPGTHGRNRFGPDPLSGTFEA